MAIRYSGDVEVRVEHPRDEKLAKVTVRWPHGRASGRAEISSTKTPEWFDRLALKAIELAIIKHGKLPVEREGKKIVIRRVYQAPCPV
jgi:hypothetical protein